MKGWLRLYLEQEKVNEGEFRDSLPADKSKYLQNRGAFELDPANSTSEQLRELIGKRVNTPYFQLIAKTLADSTETPSESAVDVVKVQNFHKTWQSRACANLDRLDKQRVNIEKQLALLEELDFKMSSLENSGADHSVESYLAYLDDLLADPSRNANKLVQEVDEMLSLCETEKQLDVVTTLANLFANFLVPVSIGENSDKKHMTIRSRRSDPVASRLIQNFCNDVVSSICDHALVPNNVKGAVEVRREALRAGDAVLAIAQQVGDYSDRPNLESTAKDSVDVRSLPEDQLEDYYDEINTDLFMESRMPESRFVYFDGPLKPGSELVAELEAKLSHLRYFSYGLEHSEEYHDVKALSSYLKAVGRRVANRKSQNSFPEVAQFLDTITHAMDEKVEPPKSRGLSGLYEYANKVNTLLELRGNIKETVKDHSAILKSAKHLFEQSKELPSDLQDLIQSILERFQ
jgi:hypothetical protein